MENNTEETLEKDAKIEKRQQLVADAVADGRKLATVRQISAIDDIPGADLIKVATVEGWKVVVKAGEFKPGDLCVFFEVDSYLPMDDERFKFLEKNAINWEDISGARLKTIKLRKQLSQGLALPVSLFPEVQPFLSNEDLRDINFTGPIGVMKWEKPINAQLAGHAKGGFPSFLVKSDQERCQNINGLIFGYEDTHDTTPFDTTNIPEEAILNMVKKGELIAVDKKFINNEQVPNYYRVRKAQASRDTRYEVSLKMDGSSMTVYVYGEDNDKHTGVCSRNLDLKIEGNEDNSFVKMATSGLLELLESVSSNIALQGELMGPGIQGNRESFKTDRFFVYNVFDISAGKFMDPHARREFIAKLNKAAGLNPGRVVVEHVPVLHYDVTLGELNIHNMDDLLKFAEGPSMNHAVREGLVFKAMDGTHQFKAISNKFLEKEE